MARDINNRLQQLRNRRSGTDRLGRLSDTARSAVVAKSLIDENWVKRAQNQPNTRYALGAMQEVGNDYTRISIETAERVGKQLDQELTARGFSVDFRLQGSVPLNVHIRGVSDVDLLNLETSFLTFATHGSRQGYYTPSVGGRTSLQVLQALRAACEKVLIEKYPAAVVDTSGAKAICISGGSLARPVDVVPSHWFDNITYQDSQLEHDRSVTILNKKIPETIDNLPFLHIKHINDRDQSCFGGLKKAIRLCKNVKSDAEAEGSNIELPSFDIAAIMYHADMNALTNGYFYELAILAETQRHLDVLYCNKEYARTLIVPDGSRKIFNSEAKFDALLRLSVEMDDLAREVAKEQKPLLGLMDRIPLEESRAAINSIPIPG